MSDHTLKVNMLGTFSVEWHGLRVDDEDNRSRKSWLLLAYLFCHRDRSVSREELISIVWENSDKNTNPQSAFKILLHRVRGMLGALGEDAGYEIILAEASGYRINPALSVSVDVEEFTALGDAALRAESAEKRLACEMAALSSFPGEFLPKLAGEQWVLPLNVYYHDRFLSLAQDAAAAYYDKGEYQLCAGVCRKGLGMEAYHEALNLLLLRSLDALGDQEALIAAYEKLNTLLYNNFGTTPDEEAEKLYRKALADSQEESISADLLFESLREEAPHKGAIVCDYDTMRHFCQVEARQVVRNGDCYHVAVFSILGIDGGDLTRRIRDNAMNNLQEILRGSLRSGDMVARCSASQFMVLLPQANYENSCLVCDRVRRAFFRQYPHAAVEIGIRVQPLQPMVL